MYRNGAYESTIQLRSEIALTIDERFTSTAKGIRVLQKNERHLKSVAFLCNISAVPSDMGQSVNLEMLNKSLLVTPNPQPQLNLAMKASDSRIFLLAGGLPSRFDMTLVVA